MNDTQLEDLFRAMRAQYEHCRAQARPILDAENRIRSDLRKLDRHEHAARAPEQDLTLMRSFGGDVLWMTWLGRQRRELNIQLARVLSEKGRIMEQLRRSHGRVHAIEELLAKKRERAHAQLRQYEEDSLYEVVLAGRQFES